MNTSLAHIKDEYDWEFAEVRYALTEGCYNIVVPWNHMSISNWQLAANHVSEYSSWEETRDKAWNLYPAECIKFIYKDSILQTVRYIFATRGHCGWGYKEHGMSEKERARLEIHFNEVDDPDEGPYVYEAKHCNNTTHILG